MESRTLCTRGHASQPRELRLRLEYELVAAARLYAATIVYYLGAGEEDAP